MDCSTATPTLITGSSLNSQYGSATVSDRATGALLFYTNGDTIWDKTHAVMSNGTGLFGNRGEDPSALIVPKPGSSTQYFVFTVDCINSTTGGGNGLAYSMVDMTMNSGKGAVTTKNVILLNPTPAKITAVKNCNGKDYWVLTHKWNTDSIYAYPVTSTGVGSPVISKAGMVHTFYPGNLAGGFVGLGQMKASPDGAKLAEGCRFGKNVVQIFDFCNSSGVVSNAIIDSFPKKFLLDMVWGVSFSPNSSRLYTTLQTSSSFSVDSTVVTQYDMLAGSPAAIIASKQVVFKYKSSSVLGSDLQLAPNGKIYSAWLSSKLDVIKTPDALGNACGYVHAGFSVSASLFKGAWYALPMFVESDFNTKIFSVDLGKDTSVCNGTVLAITAAGNGVSTYSWSTGVSGPTVQSINVSAPGKYIVTASNGSCCTISDTINVTYSAAPLITITGDTTVCKGSSALIKATGGTAYSWNTGILTDSLRVSPVTSTGYTVSVSNGSGCTAKDSVTVKVKPLPVLTANGTATICAGKSVMLTSAGNGTSYAWSDGATSSSTTVTPAITTTYFVIASSSAGCTTKDSVTITVNPLPVVAIAGSSSICSGSPQTITATGGGSYQWSTTETTNGIVVSNSGTYSVTVTSAAGCSAGSSLAVTMNALPVGSVSPDDTITQGDSKQLTATGGSTYIWTPATGLSSPNSSSPVASPTATTTYSVTIIDNNGCSITATVTVFVKDLKCGPLFLPTAFSPNGDGQNDVLTIHRKECIRASTLVIYNRWGQVVFESSSSAQGWDGTFKGQEADSGVYAYYLDAELIDGSKVQKKGNITLLR